MACDNHIWQGLPVKWPAEGRGADWRSALALTQNVPAFFHVAKMFTFWCCFRCLTSSNIPWLVLTVFCLYLLPQTLLVRNKTAVEICLTLTNLLLLFYSNVKSTSCSLPLRTTCSVIVVNNSWYCWTRSTFTYQSVCTVRFIFSLDKDTIIVVFCGF